MENIIIRSVNIRLSFVYNRVNYVSAKTNVLTHAGVSLYTMPRVLKFLLLSVKHALAAQTILC